MHFVFCNKIKKTIFTRWLFCLVFVQNIQKFSSNLAWLLYRKCKWKSKSGSKLVAPDALKILNWISSRAEARSLHFDLYSSSERPSRHSNIATMRTKHLSQHAQERSGDPPIGRVRPAGGKDVKDFRTSTVLFKFRWKTKTWIQRWNQSFT